jgi:hypothetical protein
MGARLSHSCSEAHLVRCLLGRWWSSATLRLRVSVINLFFMQEQGEASLMLDWNRPHGQVKQHLLLKLGLWRENIAEVIDTALAWSLGRAFKWKIRLVFTSLFYVT